MIGEIGKYARERIGCYTDDESRVCLRIVKANAGIFTNIFLVFGMYGTLVTFFSGIFEPICYALFYFFYQRNGGCDVKNILGTLLFDYVLNCGFRLAGSDAGIDYVA